MRSALTVYKANNPVLHYGEAMTAVEPAVAGTVNNHCEVMI